MLGVEIGYYANNRNTSRWFLNGESAPVEKIANTLSYQTKQQFINATSKHGVALVLSKGIDKLKEKVRDQIL